MKNFRFKKPNILHSWEISICFSFWWVFPHWTLLPQTKWVYISECWSIIKRYELGDWKKQFVSMYLKKSVHEKGARCQFPMGGTFSWRYCKAKSVHFISCSLTDSVVPPLSCSGSGSSFWKGTMDTQNDGIPYINKPFKTQSAPRLKTWEYPETGSIVDRNIS